MPQAGRNQVSPAQLSPGQMDPATFGSPAQYGGRADGGLPVSMQPSVEQQQGARSGGDLLDL